MRLVLDTNILIAATIRDGVTRRILASSDHVFFLPEAALDELAAHKEEIVRKAGVQAAEFEKLVRALSTVMDIVPNQSLVPFGNSAFDIIGAIDPDDAPFIACALQQDAALWTNDARLREQSEVRVITTAELLLISARDDADFLL